LARIGVYCRDLSRWNPIDLPDPPIPLAFQLIDPRIIYDLSISLEKLSGLTLDFPLFEFYLDYDRFMDYYVRRDRTRDGGPSLWGMLGEMVGWGAWDHYADSHTASESGPLQPFVRLSFHNIRASAVAPLVVNGAVLGELNTHVTLLADTFDIEWHRKFAYEHGFIWHEYEAALSRVTQLTMSQLEGAAAMLGIFANQIAHLAHRNILLQQELDNTREQRGGRSIASKELVRQAIHFMQENLEERIGVIEVAKSLAVSPSHLSVTFRRITGRSPIDHLIDLRLSRAKAYLEHADMSVMEVCVALGYSPSYFSRLFKSRFGYPPSQHSVLTATVTSS
jgi:AraC-like DNA-binding protein